MLLLGFPRILAKIYGLLLFPFLRADYGRYLPAGGRKKYQNFLLRISKMVGSIPCFDETEKPYSLTVMNDQISVVPHRVQSLLQYRPSVLSGLWQAKDLQVTYYLNVRFP